MRPLELVVNGFRSYAEETRFDWRGRHLVGVVGPIGSGKSSILDAIAFALYGKTPSFSGNSSALINQRQAVAQVQLTFRVAGQAWQVVRAIRRVGQGNHVLYPFDERTCEVDRGAAVSGQRAVTDSNAPIAASNAPSAARAAAAANAEGRSGGAAVFMASSPAAVDGSWSSSAL